MIATFLSFLLQTDEVTTFFRSDPGAKIRKKLRNVYKQFFSENIPGRYRNRSLNMSRNICLFLERDMPSPLLRTKTRYSGTFDI